MLVVYFYQIDIRSIFCVRAEFPLLPTYWTTQTTCLSTRFFKPRKITEIIFARISVTGIGRSYYSTWRIVAIYRISHFIDLNKNTIYCIYLLHATLNETISIEIPAVGTGALTMPDQSFPTQQTPPPISHIHLQALHSPIPSSIALTLNE